MGDHQPASRAFEFQSPIPFDGVLGFWAAAPPSTARVAFDLHSTVDDTPVWRVNLPADLDAATAVLAKGEAQLDAAQQSIGTAAERLQTFVSAQTAGSSFDVASPGAPLGDAETEALALLNEIETGMPSVSFGLGEKASAGLDATVQRWRDYVDGLLRSMADLAWVETWLEGRLAYRTSIGWGGDARTVCVGNLDAATLALHQRTVKLAVTSRNTALKTFSTAAQGAVKLAVLLAIPGSGVLALPVAWKYISQLLADINRRDTTADQLQEA